MHQKYITFIALTETILNYSVLVDALHFLLHPYKTITDRTLNYPYSRPSQTQYSKPQLND